MRLLLALAAALATAVAALPPVSVSGIYPRLAYFNTSGECGTGAVLPWADRLWIVTYAPHKPKGSDDRLYEIDSALRIIARSESVSGTPLIASSILNRSSFSSASTPSMRRATFAPFRTKKCTIAPLVTPVISPFRVNG